MALQILRSRLMACKERLHTHSIDTLAPTPLSRMHDILPQRNWSLRFTEEAPLRSCFQWLFHPECDVLNFPPSLPGDTIGVGGDGNPQYLPDHRRMWVSGNVVLEKPFFANDRVEKTTRVSSVTEK